MCSWWCCYLMQACSRYVPVPPLPPPTHYSQWWRFNTQLCTIGGGGGEGGAKIRDQGIPKAFKHEGYRITSLNCWSLPALLCNRHMYERLYNSLLHILCNNKMQTWILIVYTYKYMNVKIMFSSSNSSDSPISLYDKFGYNRFLKKDCLIILPRLDETHLFRVNHILTFYSLCLSI